MTYKKFYCDPCKSNQILKVHKIEVCECTEQHENEWYKFDDNTQKYVELIDGGWRV